MKRSRSRLPPDDVVATLALFQKSLPVRLIATSRADFATCLQDEQVSAVAKRHRAESFDFIPVIEPRPAGDAAVIGVIDLAEHSNGAVSEQSVHEVMQPLGEKNLIGADASIFDFISDADQHPFRFVVAGREIDGLVTLSDLQRLPVRAAIFAMITQLESVMASMIRCLYDGTNGWLEKLSEARKARYCALVEAAVRSDTLMERVLYTEFGDKVTIIEKNHARLKEMEFDRHRFKSDLYAVQALRNDIAHGKDFAATKAAAGSVCEHVRSMMLWIALLAAWCAASTPPASIPG